MQPFSPVGHPLLSPAAARQAPETLEAHADVALELLGLATVTFSDRTEYARAEHAVVLQVNRQVERGVEASAYTSFSRGARSFQVDPSLVDPVAAKIVAGLLAARAGVGATYETVSSLRRGELP